MPSTQLDRRPHSGAGPAALGGVLVSVQANLARARRPMTIQLDWLMSNGQIGDIVVQRKGTTPRKGWT